MIASLLETLTKLGKIDGAVARIFAEKKRIETALTNQKQSVKKAQNEFESRSKVLEEKRGRYLKEEKFLKEEREKLIARRKALSSQNNYKLQQAAEREIEHNSRILNAREEALIAVVDEVSALEKECAAKKEDADKVSAALQTLLDDSNAAFATFEERLGNYQADREELVKSVEPQYLSLYERVRERYPGDAIAAVTNTSCAGCFIQVVPQMVVEITKGLSVVRCRGCGRILYIPAEESAEKSKEE